MEVHRVFTAFKHPRHFPRLDVAAFRALQKQEVNAGGSLCPGHAGTTIWYTHGDGSRSFVVQVRLERRPDVFVVTPCSFEPTFGPDFVDGWVMEDAEYLVLHEQLGLTSNRLAVFGDAASVHPDVYLQARGFPAGKKSVEIRPGKKWWQFWR